MTACEDERVEGRADHGAGTPLAVRLRELAATAPDAPAVTDDHGTVTRRELDARTNRLARRFAALGVRAGDHVSIALPNGIRHVECSVAAWKLGAVPQPLSHRLPPAELAALVALADPAVVVGLDPADGRPWLTGDEDLGEGEAEPLPDVVGPSWKAPTSGGSTGRPKLIVAGQVASVEAVLARAPLLRIDRDGVFLSSAPLYHNAPYMFSLMALLHGHHVVLMGRFDAARVLDLVAEHRATWLYVVPTMMGRMLRLPAEVRAAADLRSLRTVLHVGAPCPPHVKRGFLDWVGPETVIELYSGTEAQANCMIDGVDWLAHPGSVGRVQRGRMSVRGEDFRELTPGEVGEIWMRPDGEGRTYSYVGASARERDGWESLGDMGSFDDEGYLYLADRQTDMILVGGANVYPAEIEAALAEHPAVVDSAVVGLPDEDYGNVVHAIVHLTGRSSPDELREFLRGRLAPYKVPRSIELTGEQLRDDAGKIRRSALREARLRPAR
ncbi:AMP-binding protein [Pseudonocardia pini]|uniref:AMP-binding protein n=1 Tax=Pseudonocardia pini TaxID=2758030 RepID=UPI0015F0245D|nr:AMP-binding protein [Pseudonocardia pini]